MIWLILFSVVPLAFLTGYSLVKFESAIDQELKERLSGNLREIEVILADVETTLTAKNERFIQNKQLIYFLSNSKINQARRLSMQWMQNHFVSKMSVFNHEGRLEVALYRNSRGEVARRQSHESSDVYLSPALLKQIKNGKKYFVDFKSKKNLQLIIFSKVLASSGNLVGFVMETFIVDDSFLRSLNKRLNIEIIFFDNEGKSVVASHDDLESYRKGFFLDQAKKSPIFDLNIQGEPYGFVVKPISWGDDSFNLIIGGSKKASMAALEKVNQAFYWAVGIIVVFLLILSFVISKIVLQPVSDLLEAISESDLEKGIVKVKIRSDNELGLLSDNFNKMSERVHNSQIELKKKFKELEAANNKIKETQSQLVHSAKMASLGQLVAGVAHELNNPIGFIYSNMEHLREYTTALKNIIENSDGQNLDELKKEQDYEYIIKDLPKLINSCEEGARRTRDIVLGLRNFSRLEEAKVKRVDINKNIDNTLELLSGELKNRIQVHKEYSKLPLIECFPSQLNQVFMNMLSNASQAINGKGHIYIRTEREGHLVVISIKDDGRGMSKEVQEKIFDPFFTTKEVGKGTGLGMSISYGIIEKHMGKIIVSSKVNKGTEFKIILPINRANSDEKQKQG